MMVKDGHIPKLIDGECPSCGYEGSFKYIGTQVWPQEVAERLGVATSIALYQCENCLTTISAPMLKHRTDD
jgi:hypothetical protein